MERKKDANPPLALVEWADKVWSHEDRIGDLEQRIDRCALANVVFRELADLGGRVVELECGQAMERMPDELAEEYGDSLDDEFVECFVCAAKPDHGILCDACAHNRSLVWRLQGVVGGLAESKVRLVEPLAAVRRTLRTVQEIEELKPGFPLFDLGGPYRIGLSESGEYRLRCGGVLKAKSKSPAGIVLAWVRETGKAP